MVDINVPEVIPKESFNRKLPVKAMFKLPVCLIITSPLPSKPVEQVSFTFKSRDHGWARSNFDSIYDGSWTWFEAMILRPVSGDGDWRYLYWSNRDIPSEPSVSSALSELAGLMEPLPKQQKASLGFVANPTNPFSHSWLIQRNRRAKAEPKEHTVIWDKVKKESETERLGWDFDADTGTSSGVGFVNSLQEGDRIAIVACAMRPGAVNYVSEAQIKVGFEGEIKGKTLTTTEKQAEATARYSPNKWRPFWSNVYRVLRLGSPPSGPVAAH